MIARALPVIASQGRPAPRDLPVWAVLRWGSIAAALVLTAMAFIDPAWGLRLFWGMLMPLAPIVFMIAPGLWRNICPLAAVGQLPRRFSRAGGRTLPASVQRCAPWISGGMFLLIVPLRHVLLDHSGIALGGFLLIVFCLSILGGLVFKGKSGWCSQFCPMLHVERMYGRHPLVVVRDRHCLPCNGCTKSCFDLKYKASAHASQLATIAQPATHSLVFTSMMPWLILGFFTQPDLTHVTGYAIVTLYARMLLIIGAGIGISRLTIRLGVLTPQQCAIAHMLAAFNLYYAFIVPTALAQFDLRSDLLVLTILAGVYTLSVVWLARLQRTAMEALPALIDTGQPAFFSDRPLAG